MATVIQPAKGSPPIEVEPANGYTFEKAEIESIVEGPFTVLQVSAKVALVLNVKYGTGELLSNHSVTKLLKSPVTLTGVAMLASLQEVQDLWRA